MIDELKQMLSERNAFNGIYARVYLKKFFREVVKGYRDYKNLLSMTIGINANKL